MSGSDPNDDPDTTRLNPTGPRPTPSGHGTGGPDHGAAGPADAGPRYGGPASNTPQQNRPGDIPYATGLHPSTNQSSGSSQPPGNSPGNTAGIPPGSAASANPPSSAASAADGPGSVWFQPDSSGRPADSIGQSGPRRPPSSRPANERPQNTADAPRSAPVGPPAPHSSAPSGATMSGATMSGSAQPGQARPAANDAAGSPPPPRRGPRKRPRRRGPQKSNATLILGGVVSAVLVISLVIGLVVIAQRTTPGEPPASAATPEQVVQDLFAAIQANDVERAVALQASEVPASELLTPEVLQSSNEIAPITEVVTDRTSPNTVDVTYLLGSEPARATFPVVRNDRGDWQLENVTTTVQITRPPNVPVLINDVEMTGDRAEALPGAYALTTSLPSISYQADPFLVKGPDSFPVLEPTPQLSPEGRQAFQEAATEALSTCMERRELEPSDCPQAVTTRDGQEIDESTIQWELEGDPMATFEPVLSQEDRTVATADFEMTANVSVEVTVAETTDVVEATWSGTAMARGSVVTDPIHVTFASG